MAHMFQDQFLTQVQKVSAIQHVPQESIQHISGCLFNEFLNNYPDIVPQEYPPIILDSNSAVCMAKNGKDTNNTRNISRRVHFVMNGENFKMHKIYWCDVGLKLTDIATNNVSDNEINTRMKYIMVRLDNLDRIIVQER